jgi:hypothetical protein
MTQGMSCNSRQFGPSANDPLNSFWQAAIGPTVILNRQEYRNDGLRRIFLLTAGSGEGPLTEPTTATAVGSGAVISTGIYRG